MLNLRKVLISVFILITAVLVVGSSAVVIRLQKEYNDSGLKTSEFSMPVNETVRSKIHNDNQFVSDFVFDEADMGITDLSFAKEQAENLFERTGVQPYVLVMTEQDVSSDTIQNIADAYLQNTIRDEYGVLITLLTGNTPKSKSVYVSVGNKASEYFDSSAAELSKCAFLVCKESENTAKLIGTGLRNMLNGLLVSGYNLSSYYSHRIMITTIFMPIGTLLMGFAVMIIINFTDDSPYYHFKRKW